MKIKIKKILLIIILILLINITNVKAINIPTEEIDEVTGSDEILEPAPTDDYELTDDDFFLEGGGTYHPYEMWIFYSGIATIVIISGIIIYKIYRKKKYNKDEDE